MIIGVSETYDVVVSIPQEGTAYEFLATPEDRTKSASIYLGNGIIQLKSRMPKLKYFEGMEMMNGMMNMDGSMDDMGMDMSLQQMDMNTVMYPEVSGSGDMKKDDNMDHSGHSMKPAQDLVTLNYGMLKAPHPTSLPKDAPVRELRFELTGNMNRYVWSMDNKVPVSYTHLTLPTTPYV